MTDAEPTIERFVDWDESYPVFFFVQKEDYSRRPARFTAAEIEFIEKAEADYKAAQELIEARCGYRP